MENDRLKILMTRANRAVALSQEIATLGRANPYGDVTLTFEFCNRAVMSYDLLRAAIKRGCDALIKDREIELESILGRESAEVPEDAEDLT